MMNSSTKRLRLRKLMEKSPYCTYCRKEIVDDGTIDHIIPISKGGDDSNANITLACKSCNYKKGNK